jgi:hypothetical protein
LSFVSGHPSRCPCACRSDRPTHLQTSLAARRTSVRLTPSFRERVHRILKYIYFFIFAFRVTMLESRLLLSPCDGPPEPDASQPRFHPEKVEVHIGGLGASCVELSVEVYFRAARCSDEWACRDEPSRAILEQAERLGVELVGSTRASHPAASGTEIHPVPPPPKHLGRERPGALRHGPGLPTDPESRGKRSSWPARYPSRRIGAAAMARSGIRTRRNARYQRRS